MAKLYISEYAGGASLANGVPQIPQEPSLVEQVPVVIGAGSLNSAAFNAGTRFVRVHADVVCSIAFGAAPTATANNKRLAAGVSEFYQVRPGDVVAVITNS